MNNWPYLYQNKNDIVMNDSIQILQDLYNSGLISQQQFAKGVSDLNVPVQYGHVNPDNHVAFNPFKKL